ncbi:MAG TPA: hypothetical protein VFN53_11690 [Acidobacteriaceae bacterium]|nr:hypothetical protein [Acidobacteriaceae bacterium]
MSADAGQPILAAQPAILEEQIGAQQQQVMEEISRRNARWLDAEIVKLDRWSEDLKFGLEQEIKDLDQQIRDAKRTSSAAVMLEDKLAHQRTLNTLQSTRNQRRKGLFAAQDEVETRRDGMIASIEARMKQGQMLTPVFTVHWRLA